MKVCIDCRRTSPVSPCPACKRRRDHRRGSSWGRGYGAVYRAARVRVLERDAWVCHWCGGQATTADHLVPVRNGGSGEDDNLVAACMRCNVRRSNVQRAAERRGAGGHR